MNSGLDYFDGILYINLPIRVDRRQEIENELKKVGADPLKTFRIEAFYDELNGTRGCAYSHVQALDFAIEKGWKNVLILEDDCLFMKKNTEIRSYISEFVRHFENRWDVFFLGAKVKCARETSHDAYVRVLFSVLSHAYAVNGLYFKPLRDHFADTYESMREDLFFISCGAKSLDRRWVELQLKDRWFVGIDPVAIQSNSYSDIEKTVKLYQL